METRILDQAATPALSVTRRPSKLPFPARVDRRRIVMRYAVTVGLSHLAALLALLPWLFTWTGVIVAMLGLYVFGSLGINLYYHRILTHRGVVVPRWVEFILGVTAVCCVQDTPARWVAVHRRHHEHSDQQNDPHSPWVNFFWSHVGWMLVENGDLGRLGIYERYAKDIVRDPFQKWLERSYGWIVFAHWIAFFAAGAVISLLGGGDATQALQFGASLLVWGAFVRTVMVWHITWSVNSLSHLWGYRNYETGENSRNNVFVALISNGEGWHNNHHADPRSARHGHRWFELDVVYLTIRMRELIGLARKVVVPKQAPRRAVSARVVARSG
jgi:stearoyl-CoA desaturase (delta-9 desaturase)